MRKFYISIFLIFIIFLLNACVIDLIKVDTTGVVLDYDTKEPLQGVLIKDTKYGGPGVESDSTGRFKLLGTKRKRIIEVTKVGYKPFHLEMFTTYKNHERFENYVIANEEHLSDYGSYEMNSNCFKVINNDSLVIELEKQ